MQCCYGRAFASMWIVKGQTRKIFFSGFFPPTFSRQVFKQCSNYFWRVPKVFLHSIRFQSVSKVPGIASNIVRNKSALVVGICPFFTCFQTAWPAKTWLPTQNRIFSSTSIPLRTVCRSSSNNKKKRRLILEIDWGKYGDTHISKISQMSLTSTGSLTLVASRHWNYYLPFNP